MTSRVKLKAKLLWAWIKSPRDHKKPMYYLVRYNGFAKKERRISQKKQASYDKYISTMLQGHNNEQAR